jgi:hypothetical protein
MSVAVPRARTICLFPLRAVSKPSGLAYNEGVTVDLAVSLHELRKALSWELLGKTRDARQRA